MGCVIHQDGVLLRDQRVKTDVSAEEVLRRVTLARAHGERAIYVTRVSQWGERPQVLDVGNIVKIAAI